MKQNEEKQPFLEDMSFWEHIGELRKRLIWVVVVLVIGMVIGLVVSKPIIEYLKHQPPATTVEWNVFSPWDSIRIYMNVAFTTGFIVALPVTLYQIWAFVKPGLRVEEQRASLLYIPGAVFLFLLGMAFGYFVVFPMAFYFTSTVTQSLALTETYGISQYFSFMFNILLPLSILFQLPVVVMFLTKLRILNPRVLSKFRRYAFFVLVILGTLITPPDAISAIIVAVPMMVLYEFSVILSRVVYHKQLVKDAEREAEYA
jgi:sec-independent protein translocase protein TatC